VTKPTRSRAPAASSKDPRGTGGAKRASSASNQVPSHAKAPAKTVPRPAATSGVRVIAVANQKGGVGKSTTAVSLGAALAELGHRVLVVDLDPQGNASTGLGIRHENREVTVYDVLAAEAPIEGAVVPTPIPGLFAVPSTIDLAGAEIELVSQFSREMRLRKALEPLRNGVSEPDERFGFILLDCPPSLGLLTVNALAAAEELIVPIQCEYYALEGLGQLLRNVRLVQQNVNPALRLTGIVMTMFDPRTKLSEQVVAEVRRYFGDHVYRTIIPRTVRLSEAPGFGQPITVYDPSSKGARSYRELAREVVDKLPADEPMPVIEDIPRPIAPPPEPAPMMARRPLVREPQPEEEPRTAEGDSWADLEDAAEPDPGLEVQAIAAAEASPEEPAVPDRNEPEPQDEEVAPEGRGLFEESGPIEPEARPPLEAPEGGSLNGSSWPDPEPEARREPPREDPPASWLERDALQVSLEPEPPPKRWWRLFRRGGGT
jgi:chromosome partitioning protein